MEELDIKILGKLGKLTREIRKEASLMPKVGLDITEIINHVEKKIFDLKYLPAFPCTISVNDMAAHYTVFDEGYILQKGDVIKIDFGISENGFITDNAVTVEVEDNKYEKLMKTNFEGLNAAMKIIELNTPMSNIGKVVNEVATKAGFNTIHNLSGHQIAQNDLHCGLSVPNYENNDTRFVEKNMQFAIEPFLTKGEPKVKNAGPSNILHLVDDKPVRDPIAKKLLKFIKEEFPHLPFSKRWLVKDIRKELGLSDGFDKRRILYGLKILKRDGIIHEYEALASVDGEIVTQYEDCVVFDKTGKKTIITRL